MDGHWPTWLDWEVLHKPIVIEHVATNSLGLQGPIEVCRDSALQIVAKAPGRVIPAAWTMLMRRAPGEIVPSVEIRGTDTNGHPVELRYAYLEGWGSSSEDAAGVTTLSALEFRTQWDDAAEVVEHIDWFVNGVGPKMFMPDSTERALKTELTFKRGPREFGFDASWIRSSTNDACRIQMSDLDVTLLVVPKEAAPKALRAFGIAYHSKRFLGDDDAAVGVRRAFGELVGFLLGRQLISVGWSRFSVDGKLVSATASIPWGTDLESVLRGPSRPPVPLHDPQMEATSIVGRRLRDTVTALLGGWTAAWNELAVHDALWQLWLARKLPLGANLPLMYSGLEAMASAWHRSQKSKTKGQFIPAETFKQIIGPGRDLIAEALRKTNFDADRVLRKFDTANQMGSTAKLMAFFADARVELGQSELDALKTRHAVAHGGGGGEEIAELLSGSARLENVFHRTMLRLIGHQGEYIDYSEAGWPSRAVDEPSGGSPVVTTK